MKTITTLLTIILLLAATQAYSQIPGVRNIPGPIITASGHTINQGDTIIVGESSSATNVYSYLTVFAKTMGAASPPTALPPSYRLLPLRIVTISFSAFNTTVVYAQLLTDNKKFKNIWIIIDFKNAIENGEIKLSSSK